MQKWDEDPGTTLSQGGKVEPRSPLMYKSGTPRHPLKMKKWDPACL